MVYIYIRKLTLCVVCMLVMLTVGVSANANETGFPEFDFKPEDAVTVQPEGELKVYERHGANLSALIDGVEDGSQSGLAMEVVFDNDGKTVWFYNPISTAQTSLTWVKGEIRGDKVVIPEGSLAWYGDYVTYYTAYVLTNLKKVENGEGFDSYECIPGDIEFSYVDGVFKLLPNATGEAAIGLMRYSTDEFIISYDMNYKWLGYGDLNSSYTLFTGSPIAGPSESSEIKKYALTYKTAPDMPRMGHLVDVVFEDSKLFVRGLSEQNAEQWVYADVVDDRVVFPSEQYVGIANVNLGKCFMYLYSALIEQQDGEYYLTFAENTQFDYDVASGKMSSNGALAFNRGNSDVMIDDYFLEMTLEPYVENPERPANPTIGQDYIYEPDYEMTSVVVEVPCLDVEGNYLPAEYLSFRIFKDGSPFVFTPDVYFGLMEPMSLIPYDFDDGYDIYMLMPGVWQIQFYGEEPQSLGVQSVYANGGVVKESDIITFNNSGLDDLKADATVRYIRYYNLAGLEVDKSYKGIVIEQTVCADGTVKTHKVARM